MSNNMKLIFENWRRELNEEEGSVPKPEIKGDFYDLFDLKSDEQIPLSDEGKIEAVSVKEFLNFFAPIKKEAEFYDKMDQEIDNVVERFLVPPLQKIGIQMTEDRQAKLAKFIGVTIRGTIGKYVGDLSGAIIEQVANKISEYVLSLAGPDAAATFQDKVSPIVQEVIKTIGGQYVAEFIEEMVSNSLKFNIKKLGELGTDAGKAFSVSEPIGKLIDQLENDQEEKLASTMIQVLSNQLVMIQTAIKKEIDRIQQDVDDRSGGAGYQMMQDINTLYQTPLSELPNYDGKVISANRIALDLVAKSIGVNKIELSESRKRRRIVYRGRK
jgi:biotin operon repressor